MKNTFFALCAVVLVGCSTTVPMKDLGETDNSIQGAILSVKFTDDNTLSSGKCEIEIRNIDTKKSYAFDYRVGQRAATLPLQTGTYYISEMYCGNKGTTDFTKLKISPFTVYQNKLTVVPPFSFFRTRDVDYWSLSPSTVAEGITNIDFELPAEQKHRLVKPKTGEPFSFADGLKDSEI